MNTLYGTSKYKPCFMALYIMSTCIYCIIVLHSLWGGNSSHIWSRNARAMCKVWQPRQLGICRLEAKTSILYRFVIGHSIDEDQEAEVDLEMSKSGACIRLPLVVMPKPSKMPQTSLKSLSLDFSYSSWYIINASELSSSFHMACLWDVRVLLDLVPAILLILQAKYIGIYGNYLFACSGIHKQPFYQISMMEYMLHYCIQVDW